MTLGLLDLSIVTDRLLKHLVDAEANSRLWDEEKPIQPLRPPQRVIPAERFNINFTGLAPDAVRHQAGCQVSLFLFHVAPDKYHRNTFPLPDKVQLPTEHLVAPRARKIPEQPLALTLYYLLSAHSKNYIEEQQALSIALKCFHEHPVLRAQMPNDSRIEEFTLTMEPESVDEIGRLWQAMSSPLRLSVVYRASVIFLEPEEPLHNLPQQVKRPEVKAYPQLVITRATVTPAGLATITGTGFIAESLVVKVDGEVMDMTTTQSTQPLGERETRIVSPTTFVVRLAASTAKGPHCLSVQLDPGQPEALFTLEVP